MPWLLHLFCTYGTLHVFDRPPSIRSYRTVMNDNYPAITAYTFLQPLKRVVSRIGNPAGAHYHDETLECGHTVLKLRGHKRKGQTRYYLPEQRRCPLCKPDPPPLLDVEVILDERVPYSPNEGRYIGFHYLNEAGRISLARTNKVRMHPDYHASLTPSIFRRRRLLHGLCEVAWKCKVCGAEGRNPGGRARHYQVKHGKTGE